MTKPFLPNYIDYVTWLALIATSDRLLLLLLE